MRVVTKRLTVHESFVAFVWIALCVLETTGMLLKLADIGAHVATGSSRAVLIMLGSLPVALFSPLSQHPHLNGSKRNHRKRRPSLVDWVFLALTVFLGMRMISFVSSTRLSQLLLHHLEVTRRFGAHTYLNKLEILLVYVAQLHAILGVLSSAIHELLEFSFLFFR